MKIRIAVFIDLGYSLTRLQWKTLWMIINRMLQYISYKILSFHLLLIVDFGTIYSAVV
jgi:hypothetical protein